MTLVFLAIGLAAAFALLPLLVRTLIDPHFRLWPTPGPGSWQSAVFWPTFRILNIAAFAAALSGSEELMPLPAEVRQAALLVLGAAGAVYAYALLALGKENTYCNQEGLVTHGIYRWTRNPQYAAVIPVYAALAVAANSGPALILCGLLIATYVLMALVEEPWLEAAYGDSYRRYKRRVPRFFNWRRAWVLAQAAFRGARRQLAVRGHMQHAHLIPIEAVARLPARLLTRARETLGAGPRTR